MHKKSLKFVTAMIKATFTFCMNTNGKTIFERQQYRTEQIGHGVYIHTIIKCGMCTDISILSI